MEHAMLQNFHSQITLLFYQIIVLPDNYLFTKKRTKNLIKRLQKDKKLLKD